MAFNFNLMIVALLITAFYLDLSSAVLGGGGGGRRGSKTGSYEQITDLNDPAVQSIAKFAVDQHNKEAKTDLKYVKLVKGETQVVSGTNYKLVILATDGGASHQFEAIVWEKPWIANFKKLTSFTQLN